MQGAGRSFLATGRVVRNGSDVAELIRCYSDKAPPVYNPPTGRRRKFIGAGRFGTKLRDTNPAALERMKTLLGAYEMGLIHGHPKPVDKVTISNLQTIRYLNFPRHVDQANFKQSIARYKMYTLHRELQLSIVKTNIFLESCKAGSDKDFAPDFLSFKD